MRDTDTDWNVLGEQQPYFGVLSQDRYLSDRLTPEVVDEFYASGVIDVEAIVGQLRRLFGDDFAPALAVDFGCGVGRLALAMATFADRVIGVDVAPAMIDIAAMESRGRGVANVEFQVGPLREPVDWINSLIVFQHIPPRRGLALLNDMLCLLRPGGYVSVQLTFYRDSRHQGEVIRALGDYRYDGESIDLMSGDTDAPPGVVTMYDYDLNRVFAMLFEHGLESLSVHHTDHAGCHGVFVYGRRPA
jgi:SAM-dependent methyltransferase